jgi:hypothetical protein
MASKKGEKDISQGDVPITLRIDSGYVVAEWVGLISIAELVWQHLHGSRKNKLVLKPVAVTPRQFEREVAEAGSQSRGKITLRIDSGYIMATALVAGVSKRKDVFPIIWERRHGEAHNRLLLERSIEIPREFEAEIYGEPPAKVKHGRR